MASTIGRPAARCSANSAPGERLDHRRQLVGGGLAGGRHRGSRAALGEPRRLAGEGHRRQRLADPVEQPVEGPLARDHPRREPGRAQRLGEHLARRARQQRAVEVEERGARHRRIVRSQGRRPRRGQPSESSSERTTELGVDDGRSAPSRQPYGGEMPSPASPPKVPAAARFLPNRVFYGWYVALACGLMMWVTVGVGYYGLSIFLRPLEDEHDWSAGVVSGASGPLLRRLGRVGVRGRPADRSARPEADDGRRRRADRSQRGGGRLRRDGLAAVPRLRGDGPGLRHGRRRRRRLDHVQVVHPPPGEGHLAVLDRACRWAAPPSSRSARG